MKIPNNDINCERLAQLEVDAMDMDDLIQYVYDDLTSIFSKEEDVFIVGCENHGIYTQKELMEQSDR